MNKHLIFTYYIQILPIQFYNLRLVNIILISILTTVHEELSLKILLQVQQETVQIFLFINRPRNPTRVGNTLRVNSNATAGIRNGPIVSGVVLDLKLSE